MYVYIVQMGFFWKKSFMLKKMIEITCMFSLTEACM